MERIETVFFGGGSSMEMKTIIWIPTWSCGNKCFYCDYQFKDGILKAFKQTYPIGPELESKDWIEFFSKINSFNLVITGGEPTNYKGLPNVLEKLPDGVKWSITSNSLNIEAIKKIPFHNNAGWTASYHFKEPRMFDYNIWKISKLQGFPQGVRVTMVITPWNHEKVWEQAKEYMWKKIGVNIHPFLNQEFSWEKNQDIIQLWRGRTKETGNWCEFIEDIPDFFGGETHNSCHGGKDFFIVWPDGRVMRCYSEILRGEFIGHIKDFIPFDGPKPCTIPCVFPCDKQLHSQSMKENISEYVVAV
jgi:hypothetical protein